MSKSLIVTNNKIFANSLISDEQQISLIDFKQFPSGEWEVKADPKFSTEVELVFFLTPQINDSLIQLYLICDALMSQNCKINLTVPYLPYSRQDKNNDTSTTLPIRAIARLLDSIGHLNKIKVIDIHNQEILRLFHTPINSIDPQPVWLEHLDKLSIAPDKCLFIAPDQGAGETTKNLAEQFGGDYVVAKKERTHAQVTTSIDTPAVRPNIIICDDMIDSGKTISATVEQFLNNPEVEKIIIFVTHAVLSCPTPELKQLLKQEKVTCVTTDTVPLKNTELDLLVLPFVKTII